MMRESRQGKIIPRKCLILACAPKHLCLQHQRMVSTSQNSRRQGQRAFDLQRFLETRTAAVNAALDRFLPSASTRPATIHQAMRYSLFAGGKRMRPALCLAAAAAGGGRAANGLRRRMHPHLFAGA
jgi:hypothetical protein